MLTELALMEKSFFLLYSTNVVMNYTEVESKVREATNDDPWGPSGQLMSEISRWTTYFGCVFLTT